MLNHLTPVSMARILLLSGVILSFVVLILAPKVRRPFLSLLQVVLLLSAIGSLLMDSTSPFRLRSFADLSGVFGVWVLICGLVITLAMHKVAQFNTWFSLIESQAFFVVMQSVLGFCFSNSGPQFFVFGVFFNLGGCVLLMTNQPSRLNTEGALKFLVHGLLASSMIVFGIGLLAAEFHAFDLHVLVDKLNVGEPSLFAYLGGTLLLSGLCFGFGIAPFHLWLPDAFEAATPGVAALLSICSKIMSTILLLKLLSLSFNIAQLSWQTFMLLVANFSILFGHLMALTQSSLKRMLAYSSVAQSAFIVIAVCSLNSNHAIGLSSLIFLIVSQTISFLLFCSILMHLESKSHRNLQVDDLIGFYSISPRYAILLALALLDMAGLPPTVGFFAKVTLLFSAVGSEQIFSALVIILGSILGFACYLRVFVRLFRKESSPLFLSDFPKPGFLLLTLGAAIVVFGTLIPEQLARVAAYFSPSLYSLR